MRNWIIFAGTYILGTILIGVGITEYLKAKTYQENMHQTPSFQEKIQFKRWGDTSRTIGALCILFGVGSVLVAAYFPLKLVWTWCVRRYNEYEQRMAALNSRPVSVIGMDDMNENPMPEDVEQGEDEHRF